MPVKINNLSHVYMKDTPFEHLAIDDINLEIKDGEFIGLIGHTGSGKSTLIQHMNGLLKATTGDIEIDDLKLYAKETKMQKIRQKVGLVFQYPEYQLFEETVARDIAFGPKNLGLSDTEIEARVKEAMGIVGINYEKYKDISPFELSGGQKRRVAIAGVLAMKPKVLILDEPTAGLDPKGREQILEQIRELHKKQKITVIFVSHSMEDIANMVDRIIVMNKGKIFMDDIPKKVFIEADLLESIGLGVPQITSLVKKLNEKGFQLDEVLNIQDAKKQLLKIFGGNKKC